MAVLTDAQLTTLSDVIAIETTAGANTATRIGAMFQDIIDSKVSRDDGSLLGTNNLSDVADAPTSLRNIGGLSKITTWAAKAGDYTLTLADFDNLTGLEMSAVANAVTVPPNATVAVPVGSIIYGITLDASVTTVTPGAGVTILSSSGAMTIDSGTGNLLFWALQKRATNTWYLYNGAPVVASPFAITFLASTNTFTNMAAAEVELVATGTTYRFRTKADLTNYTQCRIVVGCSLAGAAGAQFYLKYATTDTTLGSFITIGSGTGTEVANIAVSGTSVSSWITIPAGAKADVFLMVALSGGDAAVDPVCGTIIAQFR